MKKVKEIKKGLMLCASGNCSRCGGLSVEDCPYFPPRYGVECDQELMGDVLEYVEQLEERIAIMMEGCEKE